MLQASEPRSAQKHGVEDTKRQAGTNARGAKHTLGLNNTDWHTETQPVGSHLTNPPLPPFGPVCDYLHRTQHQLPPSPLKTEDECPRKQLGGRWVIGFAMHPV